jgi:hypothetical protein
MEKLNTNYAFGAKGIRRQTPYTFILLFALMMAASMTAWAQTTEKWETAELVNFGVDDTLISNFWSWSSGEFVIADNPAGEEPAPTARKWQKGGNWTGFGTTFVDSVLLAS